VNMVTPPGE